MAADRAPFNWEDPLQLTDQEQKDLTAFINSLTDTTGMTTMPTSLPAFDRIPEINNRTIGGKY